jgi:hypothetical protein
MEERKLDDVFHMNEAFLLLKNSVGKQYRIDCRAINPMDNYEFTINRGVITDVKAYLQSIFVYLEGTSSPEIFSASRMKEIKINDDESMIQFIYMDNSYFKVYISEGEK